MSTPEFIENKLTQSADLLIHAIPDLVPAIEAAAQTAVNSLLSDGKILTCGSGLSACLSQFFTTAMLSKLEHERPGLPAISLAIEPPLWSSIARESHLNDTFAKPLRALGKPGDALITITTEDNCGATIQAIQAAHDRELPVIALIPETAKSITALMAPQDVVIATPKGNTNQTLQMHWAALSALCDAVEHAIFGVGAN